MLIEKINEFTTTATDRYTEVNDKVLDAVVDFNRKAVDRAVKAADRIGERFDGIDLPDSFDIKMPHVELPFDLPYAKTFTDRMEQLDLSVEVPTAAEAGERYLHFVERAVELNREYAKWVIDLLTDRVEDVAQKADAVAKEAAPAKKPRKTAAKRAAK